MNELATARCAILSPLALAAQGDAPEWIMVMPAGPQLKAVDGRSWRISDPAAVIETSLAAGLDLPIDWEHAQDHKAPRGERADAAGWIDQLELREGAVWARVSWTDAGRRSVESRGYRYISPAFMHSKSGEVARIIGAGLVNRPAFATLPALAQQAPTHEDHMDQDLLDALGLPAATTKADVITAIGKLRGDLQTATAAMQNPPLEKFVPRADYDQVMTRATAAEQKLAERDAADLEAKVNTLVEDAVKAGKIAPASKDHYVALARKEFASVENLLKVTAPVVTPGGGPDPSGDPAKGKALTDEEKALCAALGISEEAYAKTEI